MASNCSISPRRVIIFGGQGSSRLFSPSTASVAKKDAESSTAGSLLASRCYTAFLEEHSSLGHETRQMIGIETTGSITFDTFLIPPPGFHSNSVIQSTTLCLYQLLHYISECQALWNITTNLHDDIEDTMGFCAGLLPAVTVSCSSSIDEFLKFAVEAFKLSFWIGCRAAVTSLKISGDSSNAPWVLVASGLTQEQIKDKLELFCEKALCNTIKISAVSAKTLISIAGPSNDLERFQKYLGSSCTTKFAHVNAWYHGGDRLAHVVQDVIADVEERGLLFPDISDLKVDLISPFNGATFSSRYTQQISLLEWVLQHIFVHPVNWDKVSSIVSTKIDAILRRIPDTPVHLVSFGPGSQSLTGTITSQVHNTRLEMHDFSPFESPKLGNRTVLDQQGIAIVGMGFQLPKGNGPGQLWDTISSGLSAVKMIPESRFKLSDYYAAEESQKRRQMQTQYGAFIDDVWEFDNAFFNISPREAKSMDPQQRILLHTAQAALDDAGYVKDSTPSFQSASVGCYIGLATGDYTDNLRDTIDVFYSPGTLRAFHSGRISYVYKLSGPSIVTDTACSSSMVSIYQACRALQNGDCSAALAGGVNVMCSPDMYLGLSRGHFLSPTGGCKPFDEAADGYCRAEGSVVFVLKRLSDAIAENDRIHGIIRDIAVNQSGNAHSITHPHSETQIELAEKLFQKTEIDPASINVVEAHGTGTQAGDTREIASIQQVFKGSHSSANPLFVSSIKGNIGHCEAASGAAGLAKLLLMLQKEEIPMQAGLRNLNPRITGLEAAGIVIPRASTKWKKRPNMPRRAMLSNFGAAGSNAALILEEALSDSTANSEISDRSAYIFNLSAKSQKSLTDYVLNYHEFLSIQGSKFLLQSICYTASARRQIHDYRISICCQSLQELQLSLRQIDPSKVQPVKTRSSVIFVFSGQGAVYHGMGAELLATSPIFKDTILYCDKIVRDLGFASIIPWIEESGSETREDTDDIVNSQCACVALEYALARLLMSWNVKPTHLIGHSLGEYAALAVSGALSIEEILRIVATRGKLMSRMCRHTASGMLACKLSPAVAEKLIEDDTVRYSNLTVACRNSNRDCVIAGKADQLALLQEECRSRQIKTKRLEVPFGYHSSAMDPILSSLEELGDTIKWSTPTIPLISTLFGRLLDQDDLNCQYFALHARQPVRFMESIANMTADGKLNDKIFFEIGPHPITLPMIRSDLNEESLVCLPTLQRMRSAWASICASLSQASLLLDQINWREIYRGSSAKMADVPGYPLKGTSFAAPYQEHNQSIHIDKPENFSPYSDTGLPLLPRLLNTPSSDADLEYETTMSILSPLIEGHNVGGTPICPASVFHELAMEAARSGLEIEDGAVLAIKEMKFSTPLIHVPAEGARSISVQLRKTNSADVIHFSVTGKEVKDYREIIYCTGIVESQGVEKFKSNFMKDSAIVKRQSTYLLHSDNTQLSKFQTKVLYDAVFTRVVRYSKEYQTIKELSVSDASLEGIGLFTLPMNPQADKYIVNPVFTDTLLHAAGFIANLSVRSDEICICSHVQSIEILYPTLELARTQQFSIYCSLLDIIKGVVIADAYAIDQTGNVIARARGMEFKRLRITSFQRLLAHSSALGDVLETKLPDIILHPPQLEITSGISAPTSGTTTPYKKEPTIDTIRSTLLRIICSVGGFKEETLGFTDTLENLGVDSLMQIEISAKLKQAFPGHFIDHNELAHCETIQALENTIISVLGITAVDYSSELSDETTISTESRGASSVSSVSTGEKMGPDLLQISPNSNTTLCLFHDGSGTTRMYAQISSLDRTTYAFSDPYLFDEGKGFSSLKEMASQYADRLILSNLPALILGGWSFGGVVAFEAAKQLLQAGYDIKGLILIDSPYPINHEPLPDAVIRNIIGSTAIGTNATIANEFQANANLLGSYQPMTLGSTEPIKTVMLRSRNVFDTQSECGVQYDWLSNQKVRDAAIVSWERLVGCNIEVLSIPGNHFEAFSSENISETTAQLQNACKYIEGRES